MGGEGGLGSSLGLVIPMTYYSRQLSGCPIQVHFIVGSVLGLVDTVSLCCVWVRWQVCHAVSVTAWQYVNWSMGNYPCDMLSVLMGHSPTRAAQIPVI